MPTGEKRRYSNENLKTRVRMDTKGLHLGWDLLGFFEGCKQGAPPCLRSASSAAVRLRTVTRPK